MSKKQDPKPGDVKPEGEQFQPISNVQLAQLKIEWVPRDSIKPNQYNPNKMTWQDRQLLKTSLLEDGWTQPIITLPDHTIVDGEQRWTTAGIELHPAEIQEVIDKMEARKASGHPESASILARLRDSKERLEYAIAHGAPPCLASITNGLVPITLLDLGDDAHKILSTIRHNRARGSHQVDSMAGLASDLVKLGLEVDDLEQRLGMDTEEIDRLLASAEGQVATLEQELTTTPFSPVTEMIHIANLPEDAARVAAQSAELNQQFKDYQLQVAARQAEIERQKLAAVAAAPASLTQTEKDKIAQEIASRIPMPEKPKPPELKKLVFFVTPDEYADVAKVLGIEMAKTLVALCRAQLQSQPA